MQKGVHCNLVSSGSISSTIHAMTRADRSNGQFSGWIWSAGLFLGIGLLDAAQTVFSMHAMGMHHSWVVLFGARLFGWLPWTLATPLIFRLTDRYPLETVRAPMFWAAHLSAVLVIGLVKSLWDASLDITLHPYAPDEVIRPLLREWREMFYGGLLAYVVLYAFVFAIRHALASRETLVAERTETARLNEQLATAQLEALRRQMEPHFLFNSLNAIVGLVRDRKNEAAVSSLVQLSDFLRRIVSQPTLAEAPLQTEIELLQLYLHVQQLRFAERLQTRLEVPSELLRAQVPILLLQLLVENAIKHGISKRARGGLVRVTAARSDNHLMLTVYNDGPALKSTPSAGSTGVGISNLRARLQLLYGSGFVLRLCDQPPEGVQAVVSVPYRER
jgi:signal transduction histidine kinase